MRHNLLFLSGEPKLVERIEAALASDCAVLVLDPRGEANDAFTARFNPHAIMIDAGAHTGARTTLERIAAMRAKFPTLPLIALGDEMSAQLILAAFRAGVNDFLDRDAPDSEIRNAVRARLQEKAQSGDGKATALVNIFSPSACDEDSDLALNIASMIAASDPARRTLLLDLSLPATPVHTALGLECNFTVTAALRDLARLDRTFLDSALARTSDTGLCVLPLADQDGDTALPGPREFAVLLQILGALFDTVVVYWGTFSRPAVRAGIVSGATFVGCNQRFSSIRNAKAFIGLLANDADPILAIHQLDSHLVPSAQDIVEATGARRSLTLRANWAALAMAHNSGRPLGLMPPSPYSDALRTRLAQDGFLPHAAPENTTVRLLHWLNGTRA